MSSSVCVRYQARGADGARQPAAFGKMDAELEEDSDPDLDSDITDDAEDELLGYGDGNADLLDESDDDF